MIIDTKNKFMIIAKGSFSTQASFVKWARRARFTIRAPNSSFAEETIITPDWRHQIQKKDPFELIGDWVVADERKSIDTISKWRNDEVVLDDFLFICVRKRKATKAIED